MLFINEMILLKNDSFPEGHLEHHWVTETHFEKLLPQPREQQDIDKEENSPSGYKYSLDSQGSLVEIQLDNHYK